MNKIQIKRHKLTFSPDSSRVIIRPFIPSKIKIVKNIINRSLALSEEDVEKELKYVLSEFKTRHLDIESHLISHFKKVMNIASMTQVMSNSRELLIGALFSGEYSLESAALFNPSIVPHPDQSGLSQGSLRFIVSLRATGEGHISSIEFRTGLIDSEGEITVEPISPFVTVPSIVPDPNFSKTLFINKLKELGLWGTYSIEVMNPLKEIFTLSDLDKNINSVKDNFEFSTRNLTRTIESIRWLADSNYELQFDPGLALSERIIFPVSLNESNGIEDARFVRFVEDDKSVVYYATYTAYNGQVILPQFIETKDFLKFHMRTLSGKAIHNKGMALFPRRINGNFVMISRQDDENMFIMFSKEIHTWNDKILLQRPLRPWELVKIGNCGSPIETEDGWLLITHGVGPMRKYCIGAMLLDRNDPTIVLGSLKEPLLKPEGIEREGYVPNVVYSCGSLIHKRELILAYAMSDKASVIASVNLDDLLTQLKSG